MSTNPEFFGVILGFRLGQRRELAGIKSDEREKGKKIGKTAFRFHSKADGASRQKDGRGQTGGKGSSVKAWCEAPVEN
jgi:hypothetical protein